MMAHLQPNNIPVVKESLFVMNAIHIVVLGKENKVRRNIFSMTYFSKENMRETYIKLFSIIILHGRIIVIFFLYAFLYFVSKRYFFFPFWLKVF